MHTVPSLPTLPPDWWRITPDSSDLLAPRAFHVAFVPRSEVGHHAAIWSQSLGLQPDCWMPLDEMGLTVTTFGGIALVGATEDALAAVGSVRSVIIVPDLDVTLDNLRRIGATVIDGPRQLPVGRSVYVTMPDGTVAEWTEHRPRPGELPSSPRPIPAA